MELNKNDVTIEDEQLSVNELKEKLVTELDRIIESCTNEEEGITFHKFEKTIWLQVCQLGCLFIQLFLTSYNERLDYSKWSDSRLYYFRKKPILRRIKTVFGEVKYWRYYFVRKDKLSGGFHPLDSILGLTRDGFSPSVISLTTRLATRVSFTVSVKLFSCFYIGGHLQPSRLKL